MVLRGVNDGWTDEAGCGIFEGVGDGQSDDDGCWDAVGFGEEDGVDDLDGCRVEIASSSMMTLGALVRTPALVGDRVRGGVGFGGLGLGVGGSGQSGGRRFRRRKKNGGSGIVTVGRGVRGSVCGVGRHCVGCGVESCGGD